MKILLFRRDVSAEDGATKVLVWLANTLHRRGHGVVLVSKADTLKTPFYRTDPGIKRLVVRKGDSAPQTRFDSQKSRFKKKLNNYGEKHYFGSKFLLAYLGFLSLWTVGKAHEIALGISTALRRRITVLEFGRNAHARHRREHAQAIKALTEMLRREQPDVIVSFYTNWAHFQMAEAARRCGVPLVCSLHSDPRVYTLRRDTMTELGDFLVPEAVTILDAVFRGDLPVRWQKFAYVIPNYVANGSVPPERAIRDRVILSVGRLTQAKNHVLLIDAFARLAARYRDWRVQICGEGGLREDLMRRIAEHGLQDRVQLNGAVADIDRLYTSAAVHAFPSLYEGFGLVLIEAMASGLPTVGVAGVYPPSAFLRESGAGLLASPEPEDFAEKLAALMDDSELRAVMGRKAREYAERFASDEVASRWITLLEIVQKNGLRPVEAPMSDGGPPSPADRLPIPEEAAQVAGRKRVSTSGKEEFRRNSREVEIGWTARSAASQAYPRIHPENIYDAVDFLRAEKVRSLNEEVVARIRRNVARGRRIRVGFMVSEFEKWNGDQLVQQLETNGLFDWSFAVCSSNRAAKLSRQDRAMEFAHQLAVFKNIGRVEFSLYDADVDGDTPVEDCDFDVVFLQQPWAMTDFPRRLIGKSLCVYMHYGFMMMANHGMHYNIASFHSYLWRYFTQTEMHRKMHLRYDPSAGDKLVVTGYPKLDVYREKAAERSGCEIWPRHLDSERKRVIFAPHHSIQNPRLKMATFPWSGAVLSGLRDETPDVDWIYKPHPTLALSVERAKLMSRAAYEGYVDDWRGRDNSAVYDSGGYFNLFRTSDALITDCGSFLAEYLPTGKPIIWLVSDETIGLNEAGVALAEAFYWVHNEAELRATFRRVVSEGNDPLATKRRDAIARILPAGKGASAAVVDFLREALMPVETRKQVK